MRRDLVEERQRMRVEASSAAILKWLSNGASTDDAMLVALRLRADVYVLAIQELEAAGRIERGVWGALKVWRKLK